LPREKLFFYIRFFQFLHPRKFYTIMGVRMDAAQDLLVTTDLKAFEIAERVGFADPNYFSFCFRKKFGISPKEYRIGARSS
ncbi:helix-turn-helix transcriptional regulator, partial [Paenibacillus sp. 3LSP]|nr:helix-turn-helix transcriptional regulator [Paenibacillus sp. 3LSP]